MPATAKRTPRAPKPPYEPTEGYTLVADDYDVTREILDAARSITEGWYNDSPIDWEDVWERLDGSTLASGLRIDLGPEQDTPAMRKIQRVIRAERKAG